MDSPTELGKLLEPVDPDSDAHLVGVALAVGIAWIDQNGVDRKTVEEIINGSNHPVPSNVGARLLDLVAQGDVTQRQEGNKKLWRLTPAGGKKYKSPTAAEVAIPEHQKFILVENLPDEFYSSLVGQLNRAYFYGLYSVVAILTRKLLENLVIDLLRRRFGMKEVKLFYDTSRGRFLEFGALLESLRGKLGDFRPYSGAFEPALVKDLNEFRESGNANAHSIDVSTSKMVVDATRQKLSALVRVLVRSLQQIQPTLGP